MLKQKITQIKEYLHLKKEYKIKNAMFDKSSLNECVSWGKIHKQEQSVEDIVVHTVNKDLFGSPNYPCVIERIGQSYWDNITRFYHNPNKQFYCPEYDKTEKEPCKKTECIHCKANHEWFKATRESNQAWDELQKLKDQKDMAFNRIFGRVN